MFDLKVGKNGLASASSDTGDIAIVTPRESMQPITIVNNVSQSADLSAPLTLRNEDESASVLEIAMGESAQPTFAVVNNTSRRSDYPPPRVLLNDDELVMSENDPPVQNYIALGQALAAAGDLYRRPGYASGLLLASREANIEPVVIDKGSRLSAIIADRLRICVIKNGKPKSNQLSAQHLTTMLATEAFLQNFRPLDAVVKVPLYLPNFEQMKPGYNDGGFGQRLLYVGDPVKIAEGTSVIDSFLDVMAFATNADRTNAVALALTVLLRNFWPGGKPIGVITSTKSHGGKDTIVAFAAGSMPKVSIDFESADWAFRQGLVGALQANPDASVINIENVRLGRGEDYMASGTLERLLTDPGPTLHSTKLSSSQKLKNHFVLMATTNFGTVSEDLMNRGLPIHLVPIGNVAERVSKIGNPKHEYLPAQQHKIEAELRGMIEKWKAAGCPLDTDVRHPFTEWARIIGGILLVSGYQDFLENYAERKTADDPVRAALGQLGIACPDQWLSAGDWANHAVDLGLVRILVPSNQRETDKSRERGIGILLTAHRDETFVVETDDTRMTLKLEKVRRRFDGGEPATRYRFAIVKQEAIPIDSVATAKANRTRE